MAMFTRTLVVLPVFLLLLACSSNRIGPTVPGKSPRLVSRKQALLSLYAQLAKTPHPPARLVAAFLLPLRMRGGVLVLYIDQKQQVLVARLPDGIGSSGDLHPVQLSDIPHLKGLLPTAPNVAVRYISFPELPNGLPAVEFEIHIDGKQGPDGKSEAVIGCRYRFVRTLEPVFRLVKSGKSTQGNVCGQQRRIVNTTIRTRGSDLQLRTTVRRIKTCSDDDCETTRVCKKSVRAFDYRLRWDSKRNRYLSRRSAGR